MKIVTSTDLQQWADKRESEQYLPLLIRRLIINKVGFKNIRFIDMPGGDSIWKPGSDGKLLTSVESVLGEKNKIYIIEFGESYRVNKKLQDDLKKRTEQLNGKRTDAVFVFITTHKFKNKAKVLEEIRSKIENSNLWADIKIFDADDVETWLDHDFATSAWLSDIIGRSSNGLKGFESFWNEWLASTEPSIDEDVILARSNNYQNEIMQWFNSDSGILNIKSASRKESLLFFIASILKFPIKEENIYSFKSNIVIIKDSDTWDRLVEDKESKNFILVPVFGIPSNLGFLIDNKYKIFIPMGENDGKGNEPGIIYVEPFNSEIIYNVLETKIKLYEKTNRIIRKLGHNGTLLHLQRLLERKDVSHPAPKWVDKDNWEILLLAALVGSWSDRNNKDIEAVASIFGMDYSDIVKKLSFHIRTEEAPIRKIGDIWEASTPEIIIDYLGGYLTKDVFDRYLNVTKQVLSLKNPKYEEEGVDRLVATFDYKTGKHIYYSNNLIRGITAGYAAMTNMEGRFLYVSGMKIQIQRQIQEILTNIDWKLWATLNSQIPLIAEAGQDIFLDLMESYIKDNPQTIRDLYIKGEYSGFMGDCLYSGILWGLEGLAWFEIFFSRVVNILIGMEKLKPIKLQYSNSPFNTLSEIFCSWIPNTLVSLNNKQQVIESLITKGKDPEIIFRLLYKLLPTDHMVSSPIHRPEFIELIDPNNPTIGEVWSFNRFIFTNAMLMLENDAGRWSEMIKYIAFMNKDWFKEFIDKLDDINWQHVDYNFKKSIYQNLESWLNFANRWSDENKEKWNAVEKIAKITSIFKKIEIENPIDKSIQMFSNSNVWDYRMEGGSPSPKLQDVIKEIIQKDGVLGLIEFAKQIDATSILGQELAFFELEKKDISKLFDSQDRNKVKVSEFLSVFFGVLVHVKGINFVEEFFNDSWDDNYKQLLICSVKGNEVFWKWLEEKNLSKLYWEKINNIWPETDKEYEFSVDKLKIHNNLIPLITMFTIQKHNKRQDRIKTSDLIDILILMSDNSNKYINGATDWYHITELFKLLQNRSDVDEQTMFRLEITYFELFDGYHGLEPLTIYNKLKTDPNFFIEIISRTFLKESDLDGKTEEERNKLENASKISSKLYFQLEKTYIFNNFEELTNWTRDVIDLLNKIEDKDLVRIGTQKIGAMLANAPKDPNDGIWPIKYVRDTLEEICNDNIIQGISIGKYNSVGIRYIDRKNPGGYWENMANEFRDNAKNLRFTYPKTSEILEHLARNFNNNAKQAKTDFIM